MDLTIRQTRVIKLPAQWNPLAMSTTP